MSLADKVSVKCSGLDSEELYFMQQEQDRMKELRAECVKEADEEYRESHKYHCFRCGSQSLVEVDHEGVKIDICINNGCGAVHLDPGELEAFESRDKSAISKVQKAVLSIFQ